MSPFRFIEMHPRKILIAIFAFAAINYTFFYDQDMSCRAFERALVMNDTSARPQVFAIIQPLVSAGWSRTTAGFSIRSKCNQFPDGTLKEAVRALLGTN